MEDTEKQVPSLVYNDNVVELPSIVVPLNFNGEEVSIKMEQISAGKRRKITTKHFKTSLVGSQMQGTMDSMGFQIGILSNVIIEAPFPVDEATLGNFPDSVLDYLYGEYNSAFSEDKKKIS